MSALPLVVLVTFGCTVLPEPSQFQAGMTKQELLTRHGDPGYRQRLVKNTQHMWGPIEGIWYRLEPGTEVELWGYPVHGGAVELYFLDGADRAEATAFAPEGAVY